MLQRLRKAGIEVTEPDDIPGVRRCHLHDPFGNRIELTE
jgi:predicted enzyme related to lactoylglutathione lyase